MNRIVKFFHELRNPHCPHCLEVERIKREDAKDNKVCQSCEALKLELARSHDLVSSLVENVTRKPDVIVQETKAVPITRPNSTVPWSVRRQLLETEDKAKAALLRKAPQPEPPQEVAELEKELGVEEVKEA